MRQGTVENILNGGHRKSGWFGMFLTHLAVDKIIDISGSFIETYQLIEDDRRLFIVQYEFLYLYNV